MQGKVNPMPPKNIEVEIETEITVPNEPGIEERDPSVQDIEERYYEMSQNTDNAFQID